MTATSNVGPATSVDTQMTADECATVLRRGCFGHLAYASEGHANVRPIRYVYRDGWAYFRADAGLRKVIARRPWLVLAVTELQESTRISSVIARGGCYDAEQTGTAPGDATALEGILELRDRPPVGPARTPRVTRASRVFRLHVDELNGVTAFVPCPAGQRPYDALEMEHLRDVERQHTATDNARADDDGMAESNPPRPGRPGRSSRRP